MKIFTWFAYRLMYSIAVAVLMHPLTKISVGLYLGTCLFFGVAGGVIAGSK